MKNMKKRLLFTFALCISFLFSFWAHANLFDDIFDPNKTFVAPEVSIDLKKPTSIDSQNLKVIEAQFERIKKSLAIYGPTKKKEIYTQASKNITKLIKTRSTKVERDALTYLNTLVTRELNALNTSTNTLNELFGIEEKECIKGYIYKDNECIKDSSTSNTTNTTINPANQSTKRVCSINNGYGYQYWDGYSWGNCSIIQCNEWYYVNNNSCVRNNTNYWDNNCYNGYCNNSSQTRYCSVANWGGRQSWNGSYWGTCYAENCNAWYYLSWGSCVKEYLYCWDNQHYEAGSCISNTKTCSINNGYGRQTWNGNSWSSCYVDSCNYGYSLSGNSCIPNGSWNDNWYQTRSCSVSNWYGRQSWNGYSWSSCYAESCNSGYYLSWGSCIRNYNYDSCGSNQHLENGYCVSNTKSCSVSNWYGRQSWNGSYWGSCYAESCNSGYYLSWGSCIRNYNYDSCGSNQHWENGYCTSNTKSCSVSNWYGRQTWNGSYWGSCYVESCNSGYYLSWGSCIRNNSSSNNSNDACSTWEHLENGSCVSNSRSCSVSNGAGKQTWLGTYWGVCYTQSCNSGYYIFANACVSY